MSSGNTLWCLNKTKYKKRLETQISTSTDIRLENKLIRMSAFFNSELKTELVSTMLSKLKITNVSLHLLQYFEYVSIFQLYYRRYNANGVGLLVLFAILLT